MRCWTYAGRVLSFVGGSMRREGGCHKRQARAGALEACWGIDAWTNAGKRAMGRVGAGRRTAQGWKADTENYREGKETGRRGRRGDELQEVLERVKRPGVMLRSMAGHEGFSGDCVELIGRGSVTY